MQHTQEIMYAGRSQVGSGLGMFDVDIKTEGELEKALQTVPPLPQDYQPVVCLEYDASAPRIPAGEEDTPEAEVTPSGDRFITFALHEPGEKSDRRRLPYITFFLGTDGRYEKVVSRQHTMEQQAGRYKQSGDGSIVLERVEEGKIAENIVGNAAIVKRVLYFLQTGEGDSFRRAKR